MSWLDQISAEFIITTGDSKQYRPLWKPTSKAVEYNISEFEFPEINGTLVRRGRPRGTRYPVELYFQGDDHLDQALAFEISAIDQRPWTVSHPYHGNISVQPTSLNFDYSSYNVTKITGTLVETIIDDAPKITVDPKEKIIADKANVDQAFLDSFDVKPDAQDVNKLSSNNTEVYNKGKKAIKNPIDAENYFNAFNVANSAITNATSAPLTAIGALMAVINAPYLFQTGVRTRINTLTSQFSSLRTSIPNVIKRSDKKIYENNAGSIISAQCAAVTQPLDGDFSTRQSVIETIEEIIKNYNDYLEDLDEIQSDNGGSPDSFIPDYVALNGLNLLINFTVSNLFNIALNARQERSIFLEDDSNLVILAHRLYGLEPDDSTILELIDQNKIGVNEMLQIKKGRRIVYYI